MLFGGQAERATRNLSTIAAKQAQRLTLSAYDPVTRNYRCVGTTGEEGAGGVGEMGEGMENTSPN